MKKFRKLIPALCMLLVSALFVGTSTYAWFSMNTSVTATNMQVTAKSDSIYLLISNTSTDADAIQTEGMTNVAIKTEKAAIKPSALISAEQAPNAIKGVIDDYSSAASWYKAQAEAVSDSKQKDDTAETLTEAEFGQYVQKFTYYFTLAKGSNNAQNLTANGCTFTIDETGLTGNAKTMSPVHILLVCGKNTAEFKVGDENTTAKETVLASSVTDNDIVKVDAYVYYDGNDMNVYTNNVANLAGAKIDLSFSVTAVAD